MSDFQSALPVEEINLRYLAITRAETTCTSGQWPAPMFSALADSIRCHPRFLTQEGAAEAQRSAPRAAQPAAPAAQASPASTALPFAPVVDVTAVVSAYELRYPVLRWDLLAARWQGGTVDAEALLRGHPLQSARTLVAAFVEALASTAEDCTPAGQEEGEALLSLPALISDQYGLAPVVMEERFNSPGWQEAERVQSPCPRCASTPSVAYYRPRDDQDQPYELWYRLNWALFCTECALLSAPSNPELLRAE